MRGWLERLEARPGWALCGRRAVPVVFAALTLTSCGGATAPPTAQAGPACGAGSTRPTSPTPAAVTAGIAEYKAPGLIGIGELAPGPDGNLWFTGTSDALQEVVGRITPSGKFTLYRLGTGGGFDGITGGPDGNLWFTESTTAKIGRLVPSTGQIAEFAVPLPPTPASAPRRNTQARDIVVGADGAMWFDVQQVAGESVMPTGFVGRITTAGVVTLFAVPGGDQPIGIQAGADGNLWSRIAVPYKSAPPCALPGYTPTSKVVRTTPAGEVTEMDEGSPAFAGYVIGPDGNHWWMTSSGTLRRTTPSGHVTGLAALLNLGFWDAFHFVFGPDGNVWYVDGSSVLRLTPTGLTARYHAPGPNSGATWVTRGADGRLWFVEGASGAATIGAIRPGG